MKTTFWEKLKLKFSSQNISDTWRKVRNVALGINAVGGTTLAILTMFSPPLAVIQIITTITIASSILAGRAQYDTSKKITNATKKEIIDG